MPVYQVRVGFTGITGTPYLNTLYFDAAGGTAQQAVDAAATFWGAVDAQLHQDLSWATESEVQVLNEATGALTDAQSTTVTSGGGALTGDVLPTANQALIAWRTATIVNGKRLQGRVFIPGVPEVNAVAGILASVPFTAFANAADALIADISSTLVVWHRPVLGTGGSIGPVTAALVRQPFAVLRSRRD